MEEKPKLPPPCFLNKWSEVAQLRPTLWDPKDCSLPGSSIHGIFQARVLEWVAISFSRESSWPRDRTRVSHMVGRCFTVWATGEVLFEQRALHFYYVPRKLWSWCWLILQSLQAKCFQQIFLMESQSEILLKCKKRAHKPRQPTLHPIPKHCGWNNFPCRLIWPKVGWLCFSGGWHLKCRRSALYFHHSLTIFCHPRMILQGKWWPGME